MSVKVFTHHEAAEMNAALFVDWREYERLRGILVDLGMTCPNDPDHDRIGLAFLDDETGARHWHCVTEIPAGGPCHAEWVSA